MRRPALDVFRTLNWSEIRRELEEAGILGCPAGPVDELAA
jgi:hypothetical protein